MKNEGLKALMKVVASSVKINPKSTTTKIGVGVLGGIALASSGGVPEMDVQTTVGCITSLIFGLWSLFTKD